MFRVVPDDGEWDGFPRPADDRALKVTLSASFGIGPSAPAAAHGVWTGAVESEPREYTILARN